MPRMWFLSRTANLKFGRETSYVTAASACNAASLLIGENLPHFMIATLFTKVLFMQYSDHVTRNGSIMEDSASTMMCLCINSNA